MKKIILILITSSICVGSGFAQQFPLQTQYMYNYASINPAAVGENNHMSIRASARNQWGTFVDGKDISTEYVTFTNSFGNNGLGLTFLNDETGGEYNSTGIKLGYSHKVVIAESEVNFGSHKLRIPKSELFLGISGGATKWNSLVSVDDPAANKTTPISPKAAFGVYYKVSNLKLGVSVPGILNSNIEISSESNNNIQENHFYTMMSYTTRLNDFWSVYPSVLMKTTEQYNQFDFNLNVKFKDQIWFGTSFRQDFGPSIFVGLDFGRLFSVYSNDIGSNTKASTYSNGTHEMTIGYDFKSLSEEERKARKKKKEQEIVDSDNDGVVDSLDLCPNLAGSPAANGCPDFDMDGVPDKYDLCPELPGNIEAGCPDLTDIEKEIIRDVIENLRFEVNSSKIKRSSYKNLTKLAVMLQQNSAMFLEIHGHASSEGTVEHNLGLSARRSHSVEQFFLSKGISQNKLFIRFYGEDSPLNNNLDENQRSENRRVEFTIRFHLNDRDRVLEIQKEYIKALESINIIPKNNISTTESSTSTTEGLKITETDNEIIITKEVEKQVINKPIVTIEKEIEETPIIADEIDKPVIETKTPVIENDSDYLLVILVLSNKSNTVSYINKSKDDLNYKEIGGKYYIYAYSSPYKEDVVQFKSVYKKDSWIKNP